MHDAYNDNYIYDIFVASALAIIEKFESRVSPIFPKNLINELREVVKVVMRIQKS